MPLLSYAQVLSFGVEVDRIPAEPHRYLYDMMRDEWILCVRSGSPPSVLVDTLRDA